MTILYTSTIELQHIDDDALHIGDEAPSIDDEPRRLK
jgi:hypothetical protein